MIAAATLPHHQTREWLDFWVDRMAEGLEVLYTNRVASVYVCGEILEFIIDRDSRDEINARLAQIREKKLCSF